jgi:hypothetical protein
VGSAIADRAWGCVKTVRNSGPYVLALTEHQDVASRHVGHGKLSLASGLRRRVSRPHHICDTKLPDGAMELPRLAGGMARGPIGPAGEAARSGSARRRRSSRSQGGGGQREISEGGAGFRQSLWSTWLETEQFLKTASISRQEAFEPSPYYSS